MLTFEQYIFGRKSRTQNAATDVDKNYLRKHQNMVPEYRKVNPKKVNKVEKLKKKPHGKFILNHLELKQIQDEYKISRVSPTKPRNLGRTGISLKIDPRTQQYYIEK